MKVTGALLLAVVLARGAAAQPAAPGDPDVVPGAEATLARGKAVKDRGVVVGPGGLGRDLSTAGKNVFAGFAALAGQSGRPQPPPLTVAKADGATTGEMADYYKVIDIFGREFFERGSVTGILETPDNIIRLLRNEPAYIYRASGLPDPMVIPWNRQEVLAHERLEDVKALIADEAYESAKALLELILRDFGRTKIADDARAQLAFVQGNLNRVQEERRLALVEAAQEAAAAATTATTAEAPKVKRRRPFPRAVEERLTAILWSDVSPRVVIGDDILSEGDSPMGYDEIVIDRIEKRRVIFRFDEREHAVGLDALKSDLSVGATSANGSPN